MLIQLVEFISQIYGTGVCSMVYPWLALIGFCEVMEYCVCGIVT